ncbi:hypothetical protein [Effusibacillus pohliae]|uniref:hypothetical protein n=1 Tax=Effusibacillus pohliae TaxID=232270 RepID=UPI000373512E|nr:hypothetical protein [Effusibacillus pohliae]
MGYVVPIDEFGWYTTLPVPLRSQAVAIADDLVRQYHEVEIRRAMLGWVVRYRRRREN